MGLFVINFFYYFQLLYIVYTMYGQWSYRIAQPCPDECIFAPAFFSYLLGKCLRCKHPLLEVSKLVLYFGNLCSCVVALYVFKGFHFGVLLVVVAGSQENNNYIPYCWIVYGFGLSRSVLPHLLRFQ
ncbi:hypothetical protein Ahy_B06g081925 [Arachis hypogaea]|uniref:Uncharacterized protein n=1 Tax=Arachis hypogaea TaxID=3818 RepID=A0A444YME2_ARAHY|nr:hypothetical protein Ahy_B06g081925 [Arachis hypogaea]